MAQKDNNRFWKVFEGIGGGGTVKPIPKNAPVVKKKHL